MTPTLWPNLSAHNQAFEQAKRELGTHANISTLLQRAEHIRLLELLLILILACPQIDCAGLRSNMRRHPAIYGIAAGAVAGVSIGLATRHNCPPKINGYAYDGTPPCPNAASYDPGGKHETTQRHNH